MQDFFEGMEPPLFATKSGPKPHLKIERAELAANLRILGAAVQRGFAGDASLSFEDGEAVFDLGGASALASASGSWPGRARFSGNVLLALAKNLPPGDPFEVSVEEGRLRLGSVSTPCTWDTDAAGPRIEIPLNPGDGWLLAVALRRGGEAVDRSGLRSLVEEARERKSERVNRAAEILAPYGLSAEKIDRIVDEAILAAWGG